MDSQLRIQQARIRLHDADRLIKRLKRKHRPHLILDHGKKAQSQILWVQLRCETVTHALLFAGRDLQIIPRHRQVPNDAFRWRAGGGQAPETTADENDIDGVGFVVGDGEERLRRVAVYQLDAEDLGLWEGGGD